MRLRKTMAVALAVLCAATACGGGDGKGGGPPGTGNNDDDLSEAEVDEEIPPAPGVCRKVCCSAADCAEGETCTALDSGMGTIGVCSGAGGTIAEPGTETGVELPEGCWTVNEAQCNPLTNAGCAAGDACDFGEGDSEFEPVLGCFGGDNTQGPGESCDNALGPWCVPGFHCVPS